MADVLTAVARGLDPRAYRFGRPDGVWAPEQVDARVKPAHDDLSAHDDVQRGIC
jgi:hypothetical protein